MAKDAIGVSDSRVRGHVTLWRVTDAGVIAPIHSQKNQIQISWGFIAAQQIGYRPAPGRPSYHVSAMYLEFENVGDPADPIAEATVFDRSLGVNYFNELSASSTRDFLRVPLRLEPSLGISPPSSEYFALGETGNQLTFFAQTAGTVGVHGKTFGHTVNSKIYAATLVATPDFSDRTKDVVFARTVFMEEHQVTKEASSQIGVTWDVAFE